MSNHLVNATEPTDAERSCVSWLEIEVEDGRVIAANICDMDQWVETLNVMQLMRIHRLAYREILRRFPQ
jgi:hypothetical protein